MGPPAVAGGCISACEYEEPPVSGSAFPGAPSLKIEKTGMLRRKKETAKETERKGQSEKKGREGSTLRGE